jgi:exodeoxyribonuclease VII large subunit
MEVIAKNQWNYQFFHMLFPAILQGENAIDSINFQLSQIEKVARHFDAVAIIRGGGGDVGLSCYNNYELAKKIAQFPLPVFTGIGHATNETVCEMISFQNAITPTKLAEILLQRFHDFARPVEEARTFVIRKALELLDVAKTDLHQEGKLFRSLTDNMIIRNKHAIQRLSSELNQQSQIIFQREKNNFESLRQFILKDSRNFLSINQKEVEAFNFSIQKGSTAFLLKQKNDVLTLEKDIKNMSPENVLRRGYSITLVNGKAVKSATEVSTGITITTQLLDGTIQSTINNIELKKDE